METPYDWITVGIFAGLVVLFLQRSVGPERDQLWPYLVASIGCMVANQIGNVAVEKQDMILHASAIAGIIAILTFVHLTLRPFDRSDRH